MLFCLLIIWVKMLYWWDLARLRSSSPNVFEQTTTSKTRQIKRIERRKERNFNVFLPILELMNSAALLVHQQLLDPTGSLKSEDRG